MTSNEPSQLIVRLAEQCGLSAREYWDTLCATIMPQGVTGEQVKAFLQVADRYHLDPFTKEIFAFPSKGGIQPVVSIDGWLRLANSNPDFDGFEHDDITDDQGNVVAITCRVYRKDRSHAVTATEYMSECFRKTQPWEQWPLRMLRHKATIQAIRYAFGFAGIVDQDEAERFHDTTATVVDDAGPTAGTDRLKVAVGMLAAAGGGAPSGEPSPVSEPAAALDIDDVTYNEESGDDR